MVSCQRIIQELGQRAFGIVLLFFALPNALPFSVVPGISTVSSVPILIFACQMIFARKVLWLPKIIAEKPIKQETIARVIHPTLPYLIKIERFLKPRLLFMNSRLMEVINGIVIFCLAILLMLPIPLSNFIIAGLIITFSLGLMAKDGVFILLGYVGTTLYLSVIYLIIMRLIGV